MWTGSWQYSYLGHKILTHAGSDPQQQPVWMSLMLRLLHYHGCHNQPRPGACHSKAAKMAVHPDMVDRAVCSRSQSHQIIVCLSENRVQHRGLIWNVLLLKALRWCPCWPSLPFLWPNLTVHSHCICFGACGLSHNSYHGICQWWYIVFVVHQSSQQSKK